MSLKIVKLEPRFARVALVAASVLCIAATLFFVRWNFANSISSHIDVKRAELKPVADWLVDMAPSDPQTHYTAARLHEKTLDPADLERSLYEYEMAAALSPYNYFAWLDLGKALSLNGDTDRAEAAYQRAIQLAPNYASVQWALGNFLVRQGRTDEGFSLIAKAAASNSTYSQPAITAALQIFENDIAQVNHALGDTDVINAALAAALAGQMHFDEAFTVWSKLSDADRPTKFKNLADTLIEKFSAARRFQLAAKVAADLRTSESERPVIGQVSNGGFENGVKLRNAPLFEWQIAEGEQPQIGLSEGQPHSGKFCLLISFNSFDAAAFRSISQTVPVAAGMQYEFEAFYRADLKTTAALKWEVVNALTTAPIAASSVLANASEWTPIRVRFTMPSDADGIIIRLVREGCGGPSCPMNGSLWFDDIAIRRI